MKLRIRTADAAWMSATWVEIDVLQSQSVQFIKAQLARLPHPLTKVHLVYGGHVMSDDDATLHELGIIENATVWALPSSQSMTSFSLDQVHRICPLPHFEAHSIRVSHGL